MEPFVALLRGINVGGNNLIPMVELRKLAMEMGFSGVKTVLQSGNLVFVTTGAAAELESKISAAIEAKFGPKIDVMVRTKPEWDAAISANPFSKFAQEDPSHMIVQFMKDEVMDAVKTVGEAIIGREEIAASGRQIYITYPDNIGDSKVGKTPGWSKLTSSGTARNWNTVMKLAALLDVAV